jgi:hypothetical protein
MGTMSEGGIVPTRPRFGYADEAGAPVPVPPKGGGPGVSKPVSGLTVNLKIADTDVFARLLEVCKMVVTDERIPAEVREELRGELNAALHSGKAS